MRHPERFRAVTRPRKRFESMALYGSGKFSRGDYIEISHYGHNYIGYGHGGNYAGGSNDDDHHHGEYHGDHHHYYVYNDLIIIWVSYGSCVEMIKCPDPDPFQ